jgi:hypothetical protein
MTSPTSSTSANTGMSTSEMQMFVTLMQLQSEAAALGVGQNTSGGGMDFSSMLMSAVMTDFANGPSTANGGATTTSTGTTSSATPIMVSGSRGGQQIAAVATQLAGDLRGANNQSYDPAVTPVAAQQAWNTPGWGNGNIQCVAFVDGVFRQAGITLPATPNATDFWGAYRQTPGFSEIANGQGLPQPGDIIALSGGGQGFGHVAVVTSVQAPTNGQPGRVNFAQSNSPSPDGSLTIDANGVTRAWSGYQVQGYIRYQG